ncbi:FKBP-type peptidyl-prolyl cis-trans isomerase [Myceligenerans crystallogenes]|uniref:peptidylprolyl isomerase n=1 Tax=Myceligenerans crystallogenes TaxID=316335 RepID=A0ABP4ZSQ8_9MICO
MKQRTTAGLAAFALGSALVLAGCGTGDSSGGDASASASGSPAASASPVVAGGTCEAQEQPAPEQPAPTDADQKAVEAIEVEGKPGEEPEDVSFKTPLTLEGAGYNVLDKGDGAAIEEGDEVTFHDYTVNGADGKALPSSTWEKGAEPTVMTFGDPTFPPVLTEPFTGINVGARLVVALAGQDGSVQVHVLDVVDAKAKEPTPTKAEGEPVEPVEGLPTVELAEDGAPTLTIEDSFEEPSELVVQPLIEGDGAKVTKEDEVTVQYLGCLIDGTSFDSSWGRGAPASFPLNGVIPAWTNGLDGQTVGSQLLLVAPPADAYGEDPAAHELGGKTLVFVVDILSAKKAAQG